QSRLEALGAADVIGMPQGIGLDTRENVNARLVVPVRLHGQNVERVHSPVDRVRHRAFSMAVESRFSGRAGAAPGRARRRAPPAQLPERAAAPAGCAPRARRARAPAARSPGAHGTIDSCTDSYATSPLCDRELTRAHPPPHRPERAALPRRAGFSRRTRTAAGCRRTP